MKKLTTKLKTILTGGRGETLVESIVSVMIFTILLATVSTMTAISLRLTGISTRDSTVSQDGVNNGIMRRYDRSDDELSFDWDSLDSGWIHVKIDIALSSSEDYEAFCPVEEDTT